MKLIVGVDPGTKTGIAVVDISSDFYRTATVKGSVDDVCGFAISHGEPIMIASDKAKMPGFSRKVASSFNARYFSPRKDASIDAKKEITRGMDFSNDHEMDALASALLAKKEYSRMFEKVDMALKGSDVTEDVKELLVKEHAGNIGQAAKMLQKEEKRDVIYVKKFMESRRVYDLTRRINDLEKIVQRQNIAIRNMSEQKPRTVILYAARKNPAKKKAAPSMDGYEIIHAPHEDVKRKLFIVKTQKEALLAAAKDPVLIVTDGFVPSIEMPFASIENIKTEKRDGMLVISKAELGKAFNEAFANYIERYKRRYHEKT